MADCLRPREAKSKIAFRNAEYGRVGAWSLQWSGHPRRAVETEVAVQVGTVTKAELRARVEAYGVVEPEPAKSGHPGGGAKLAAPVAGIVVAVHVIEGQSVKAGDVVVELDDRMAQAAVDKARHALAFAEQVVDRQTRKLVFGGTSTSEAGGGAATRRRARGTRLSKAAIAQVQLASPWTVSSRGSMSSPDSRST